MNEKEESKPPEPEVVNVKEPEQALKQEREKSSEYLNRLKYLQADFENYRKRMEKDIRETVERSNEKLIVNLLDIIDELELAVQSCEKTGSKKAILDGVNMVLKKLYTILGHEGLAKIEAVGTPFDPVKHEVVYKVPTRDYAEGTVIEEVRKGFTLKEKVVRPSMVKVAVTPSIQDESSCKEVKNDERNQNPT